MHLYPVISIMNYRPATKSAAVMAADYDRDQIRRDLNSLRRNVHELCTRSMTGFDCNRFVDSNADKTVAAVTPAAAVVVKTTTAPNSFCDKV
ncbi:hypothetical protein QKQ66_gp150 [Dione juno nucleopolyhedrovirus]|uniref:Uncharacterized protein n=1 Tax=Dione juno nucleopolyhedrovirus TaxID=2594175 RepID=A0AAE6H2W9_9ABAC|nr:hypothetical protein QKQ66_gp150 [Dione juno nucleopolyhedrovirus]QDL57002.1 hypothetical protein DijuNPV-ORF-150 [Dione juno nucleopolyhedrovirus]